MFYPPPAGVDVSGLFRLVWPSHCRRSSCFGHSSWTFRFHFPASLGSTVITRFIATTDALTPAGRFFGPFGHERRSVPGRSPCLLRSRFLPFCLQPPHPIQAAAFRPFTVSFCSRTAGSAGPGPAPEWRGVLPLSGKLGLRGGLRTGSQARPIVWPNRVHLASYLHDHCYGLAVHLRQLPTPCRHDAVAFGHRPVNRSA